MFIALRELTADGIDYQAGDKVPAEEWRTTRELLSSGWIKEVPDPAPEVVEQPAGDIPPAPSATKGKSKASKRER
jgi:hypothetical protein